MRNRKNGRPPRANGGAATNPNDNVYGNNSRQNEQGEHGRILPAWVTDDLARSGIPETEAHRLGVELVQPGGFRAILGFEPPEAVDGYTIKFLDPQSGETLVTPDGRPFVRVKLERAVRMAGGSSAKYLSPKSGGQQPFITPEAHAEYNQGQRSLVLTEGEKKAVSATLAGLPTVGLVGGWGWLNKATESLLAALEPYTVAGSTWLVILDSDAAWNIDFALSMARLRACLDARGCHLKVAIIPHGLERVGDGWTHSARPQKLGLDDWIVAHGAQSVTTIIDSATDVDLTSAQIIAAWFRNTLTRDPIIGECARWLARGMLSKTLFDKVPHELRRALHGTIKELQPALAEQLASELRLMLDQEVLELAAVEGAGTNLKHGALVQAPGCDDPVEIVGLDGDMAFVTGNAGKTSRPHFKRYLVRVERPPASAANGALGGRPPKKPPSAAATLFIAANLHPGTQYPVYRHYRSNWHRFAKNCGYTNVPAGDMEASLTTFLHSHPDFRDGTTERFVRDTLLNLRANDTCGIPSALCEPLLLGKPLPTPVPGWIVMQDSAINVTNLARSMAGEDLPEREIRRANSPELFTTHHLDYGFNPSAECPKFMAALERILPLAEDRRVLRMVFGLALIKETKFNVFFILFGPAGSGKSTVIEVLIAFLGRQNICALSFANMVEKHSTGDLTKKLLNVIGDGDSEVPDGNSLSRVEGLVKKMTDGGTISVNPKFETPYDAPATARLLMATNHLPPFVDRSTGIWDRLRVLPFEQVIRGTTEENPNLRREIIAGELPGVFNWAVMGLAELLGLQRFPESPRGLEIKGEHRASCDHERVFLQDVVEKGKAEGYVPRDDLYKSYSMWAKENGYRPFASGRFNNRVHEVFPAAVRKRIRTEERGQIHAWTGIQWKVVDNAMA